MPYRFARSTTFINVNGVEIKLIEGRAYDADDQAVLQFPHLFSDTPTVYSSYGVVVEQATAAPGEKRATRGR